MKFVFFNVSRIKPRKSWDLNLLCAPLVTLSGKIEKIKTGYPLISEYSGRGNNLAVQVGSTEIYIISDLGQILGSVELDSEITSFSFFRAWEVLLISTAKKIFVFGTAPFEIQLGKLLPIATLKVPAGKSFQSVNFYSSAQDLEKLTTEWTDFISEQVTIIVTIIVTPLSRHHFTKS